uniref:NusB/RsmB/TIM44 domain-containing protein n=1 Tax=Lactuca sativa TaxID=4236 RepID=A0A9R1UVW8_LACSA|nr:hypothetical protein LSAT_V11C700387660 [Lactuca sativa]
MKKPTSSSLLKQNPHIRFLSLYFSSETILMTILHLPAIKVFCLTEKKHKDVPSKPLKFGESNSRSTTNRKGSFQQERKPKKVSLEISPHRAVSAVRLMRIEFGGAFADLLNEKGKGSGDNEMGYVERTLGFCTRDLDDRDLRLVTDIVGGTIRWRKYLDYLILSLCHDPNSFSHMEPLLLQILRIGFYEIVKLEVPSYAVVDENVQLAKIALRPGAGNMVNGILRKLVALKESNSLPSPQLEGDDRAQARALATIYSHPVVSSNFHVNVTKITLLLLSIKSSMAKVTVICLDKVAVYIRSVSE